MKLDHNPSSPPLYRQLRDFIRRGILSGKWPHGSRLPGENDLSAQYGVSCITVRKALDELRQEGYVERRQGQGTFVSKVTVEQKLGKFYSFSEVLQDKGIREQCRLLVFDEIPADETLASRLDLVLGAPVYRIHRLRFADETPYALEHSYLPRHLSGALSGEMVQRLGLYRSLSVFGIYMDRATERLQAENLSEEQARLLECAAGSAAIRLERTTYSGDGKAEFCLGWVRGDFFSYTVELR